MNSPKPVPVRLPVKAAVAPAVQARPSAAAAALPLHPGPAAGFDEPFEMLAACHERVARMLGLLQRLQVHLPQHGADAAARSAALDVMRYFDRAAPQHHLDEERHVFPLLLASGDAALAALATRLQAEHLQMAAAWAALRVELQAVADGCWPAAGAAADPLAASTPAAAPDWQAFVALYEQHARAEDDIAYPAAGARTGPAEQAAMGQEMALRRGLPANG
jgi:hemerythrin-like domain-containing protein